MIPLFLALVLAHAPTVPATPDVAEVHELIVDNFGDLGPTVVEEAITVAYCESRLNPAAKSRISSATGLFQITKRWQRHTAADLSIWTERDPVANVEFARVLYDQRDGWGHWACYPHATQRWTYCVRGWVPDRWLPCRGAIQVPLEFRYTPPPPPEYIYDFVPRDLPDQFDLQMIGLLS